MDLQNVFYTLGIIVMVLMLGILVSVALLVFYIRRKIDLFQKAIEAKIDAVFNISNLAKNGLSTFSKIINSGKKRD